MATIAIIHGGGDSASSWGPVMLQLRERIQENGMRFELMNVRKPLSRVLEITHLNTVFQISPRIEFLPPVSCDLRTQAAA